MPQITLGNTFSMHLRQPKVGLSTLGRKMAHLRHIKWPVSGDSIAVCLSDPSFFSTSFPFPEYETYTANNLGVMILELLLAVLPYLRPIQGFVSMPGNHSNDDNSYVNRRLLGKILDKLNITYDVAADDSQALEYLARCIHGQHLTRPDIIYMDVGRGIVHGAEITHIIRTQAPFSTDSKTRATPIIAITNSGLPPACPAHIWALFTRDGQIRKPMKQSDVWRAARSVKFYLVPVTRLDYPGNNHSLSGPINGLVRSPIWGPVGPIPLRNYSGPRSLL
ncbi:hypothetical protein GX51_02680 [Blastomyces parvus]|uniref:Uncharacterized protein n=1 Tax=Blastomyces parvus TaxID=2060905 RepID=A0A2B7XAI0_9EURO|nr:hypothetical protein GX51_02680 [Blastomyces parvus]